MAQKSVQTSEIMFKDDTSEISNLIGVASAVDNNHEDIHEVNILILLPFVHSY